eukprot:CAMPEP_0183599674 /NCGR_PEP_ID=MMETSP0371-20130417/179553_1 /TAXON_ID=268820 /ORGANISM="Peridinium aciculiferum, Strain PAER-2" /LENGTH=240 /DNA_ID=CAMNT_0025811743 /DNA_START=8 /DNA_END=726 /DNA_ORIENTATION=+
MATMRRPVPASNSAWDCVVHAADAVCQTASAYLNGRFIFTFANTAKRTVKMHLTEDADGSEKGKGAGSEARADYFLTVPPGAEGVEVPMAFSRLRVTAGFFHPEMGSYEVFWESRPFKGKGAGSEARADYFLTVPPGAEGVEVPMAFSRLRVTAGFFHPEMGTYEVFWESRPFAYEPGCTIAVAARHSVDVNRFHIDVGPGAPLASPPQSAKVLEAPASGADLRQAGQGSLRLFALPPPP